MSHLFRRHKRSVPSFCSRCAYCDGPANTYDHVLPRSRGGTSAWSNLVPACADCNQAKGRLTPAEWLATIVHDAPWIEPFALLVA